MLQISVEQLDQFEGVQHQRFIDQCCRMLVEELPASAASETPAALRENVVFLIEQLEMLGFGNTDETEYAVSMLYRYQHEPERGPMPDAVIAKIRSEKISVAKKIEALEQMFIFGAHKPKDPFIARCGVMRS